MDTCSQSSELSENNSCSFGFESAFNSKEPRTINRQGWLTSKKTNRLNFKQEEQDMKKSILAATLISAITLSSSHVSAAASTEENVGFFSGAVTGAAVGGPIGFFVGGIAGALLGEQVEKANELDETQALLNQQSDAYLLVRNQLDSMKQQVTQAEKDLHSANQWLTEGLSLDLLFSTNSSELSEKDNNVLEKLATLLVKFPELNIRLDGFADPRGPQDSNLQLSLDRATAVQNALIKRGISENRVLIKAHGESNAVAVIPSPENYAVERKVSIKFLVKQPSTLAQN